MNRISFFVWLIFSLLQSCLKPETISSQAQLQSDTTSISSFLKANNIQATKASTGFWYSIDTLGNGVFPALTDSVTIVYTAKLIPSLKVVDDSATTVLLSSSISGIQQGLVLFPVDSYGQLYIPSGLAFGVNAHKKIPPNANLLYEIKLISTYGIRLTNDIASIESYLQSHSILAKQDTASGIRYTIEEIDSIATTPPKPVIADSIQVTYSERILNADTLITSVNTPIKIALQDQITGWRIMLPKYVAEGTTITLYIPSGYAYGSSMLPSIPANSNLVYIIDLIKVIPH